MYEDLSKDQQEAWAVFGVYPHFSWTNNDSEIVFWSGGKIHKINLDTKQLTNIPFQVNEKIKLAFVE